MSSEPLTAPHPSDRLYVVRPPQLFSRDMTVCTLAALEGYLRDGHRVDWPFTDRLRAGLRSADQESRR